MPRKRQAKVLAAIQEDEVLDGEEQQQGRRPVNAELTQLLEDLEQQGESRRALYCVVNGTSSATTAWDVVCSPGANAGAAGPGTRSMQGPHERVCCAAREAAQAGCFPALRCSSLACCM